MADEGSKVPDSDDWSIDEASYDMLNKQFGPFSVDLFAEENNYKVKKFYSNYRCPSTSGVNAFCHSWDGEKAWVCPPIKKIIQVIRKIKVSRGSGLLVVPEWPTASFWTFIKDGKGQLQKPFSKAVRFEPEIKQNQRARSALQGKTEFAFLALFYEN